MLLVKDSMTREVVTLTPQDTAKTALALCRDRRIRHLPVMGDGGLVGIVSDRDLRSAAPAFGEAERVATLEGVRIADVMAGEVATADPEDPIEQAANVMREEKIGCLPVVQDGDLVGILTSSDVMKALVLLVGANEPGSRLEVVMPDRPGTLAGVSGIFGELGINILSVAGGTRREDVFDGEAGRVGVFRVDTIDLRKAIEVLERAGYVVLWPSRP